ncbi:MAG: mycofactocin system glycosyltransferase [Candidatus Aldehydirespiratoraceae bacterium]|jgi:mycofactocin system glycosyltransferase
MTSPKHRAAPTSSVRHAMSDNGRQTLMLERNFVVDSTWTRAGCDGRIVLAGSPLRMFRLTVAGASIASAIEAGDAVSNSSLVDRLLDAGAVHPVAGKSPTQRFTAADVTLVTPQLGGLIRRDRQITVDDGSTPPIAGATIRLDRNQGPAAARNAGRAHIDTALIAFVDADLELLDDEVAAYGGASWLDKLLPHFDDPKVGLVAPRVVGDEGTSLDLGAEPARIQAGSRVSYVPAAAFVVRVDAFDAVGGFDEGLRFGEDVDFVWRLDQANWTCRFEPSSRVWHEPRATLISRLKQQAGYGSAAAPLALRHPRLLAPFRSNGSTAAAWTLVGFGHPISAAVVAAAGTAAVVRKLSFVSTRTAVRLSLSTQVASARQLASTIRRVWWPIVAAGSLISRRARWVAVAAIATDLRATPNDVAYGWGVWRGMVRHRTWRPLIPAISSWSPEARNRQAPSREHAVPPARDVH